MSLSNEQLEEMHDKVIQDNTNIIWIRDQLEKGNKKFEEHDRRIDKIEREQSFLKGKIGAFVLFLTLCGTIMIQSVGWIVSRFLDYKGGV